jgi:hypothetical protein
MHEVKTCTKCKIEKSLNDFGSLKKSIDGHNYCCKQCHRGYYIITTAVYPENYKKCSNCSEVKEYCNFSKLKKSKTGYKSQCKICAKIERKEYLSKYPEVGKEYRKNNKELLAKNKSAYYQDNKEAIKEKVDAWKKQNSEKFKISQKKSLEKNKEKYQLANYQWEKNKRATDPEYRLIRNLRSLIGQSFSRILKGKLKRSKKSIDLLSCDFNFFFDYIKFQFKEGMTLDNYGEWELDHIKPISSAKNIKEAEELNHYTNFQPLWKSENRIKSGKIEEKQLRLL